MHGDTPIKVVKGLDAVRKRPGMYIGDTGDGSGLHHMVYEVVDNAIEEALAGFATEVAVTLNADGSATVRDDGRGIPTEIHAEGRSVAQVAMTELHAGGKFSEGEDDNPYKVSGGLHGVGVAVVNALSERLELRIWRDGKEHLVRFRDGAAEAPLAVVGPARGRHGTEVTFRPSPQVFHNVTEFAVPTLERRLRELAFLTPGLRFVLDDRRQAGSQPQVMRYPNGIADFVRYLDRAKAPVVDTPIVIAGEKDGICVEAALWWNGACNEQVMCFTNTIPQPDGGTHLTGFRAALARTILGYADAIGMARQEQVTCDWSDIHEGLTAVLSVWVPDPKYSSQTKEKLVSSEVRPAVEEIVADRVSAWLKAHPAEATAIAGKVIDAAAARSAARAWGVPRPPRHLGDVRQHPQAYIGDTADGTGLLNMLYEVLDYALDEVRFGGARQIAVALNADGSATVRHDGLAFRTHTGPESCPFQVERDATELIGPGTDWVRHNSYRVPGDLKARGLAAVNALSSCLEMRLWIDGQEHLARYRDGAVEAPMAAVGPAEGRRGMEIAFWPSQEVFHTVADFDCAALERRLYEVAAFDPRLRIVLDDRRPGGTGLQRICPDGVAGLAHYLDRARRPVIDEPIVIRDSSDILDLEVALWWNDSNREQVACYTETLPQLNGGSHRDGLLAGVGRAIARHAQQHDSAGSQKVPIVGEDAHTGLLAVVAVWSWGGELTDQAKSELWSPVVKAVIESIVADRLDAWLEAHPTQAKAILDHARKAASGRAVCGFAQRLPTGRF